MRIAKGKGKVALGIAVGLLSVGVVASPAFAETVGGGNWLHGVGDTYVYSQYKHEGRGHGSSVKNATGLVARSNCEPAGKWANSQMRKTPYGNQSYWRHC